MTNIKALVLLGILLVSASGAASGTAMADSSVVGLWRLSNGKLTVKVELCNGDKICGKIAALAKALKDDGTPQLDINNPNASLRQRPVIGVQIFNAMTPTGPNKWKGKIYNADDGRTYAAYAKLNGNALEVKGCWGPFCKNLDFKRAN